MQRHPGALALVLLCASCHGHGDVPVFTDDELALIGTLSPLPDKPPPEPTNAFADDPLAAELGQRIFFDPRISGPIAETGAAATYPDGSSNGGLGAAGETGKIACSDCHMPSSGWLFDVRSNNGNPDTPNATSIGADEGVRNVSSIVNTAYYENSLGQHWRENDGFGDSAWGDARSEPEGPEIQNGSRLQLAHVLYDHYKDDYEAIFTDYPMPPLDDLDRFPPTGHPGDPIEGTPDDETWAGMTAEDQDAVNRVYANYGKSIEAYVRLLVSRNAPFDQYVAGDDAAIDDSAKRGLALFIGKGNCVSCHSGPLFSDDDFHNIGLALDEARSPWADPEDSGRDWALPYALASEFNVDGPYSDDRTTGRLDGVVPQDSDAGKWRTKELRQVGPTAPYMHNGELATLAEVVDFYDRGGDDEGTYIGGPKEIEPLGLTDDEKADLVAFLETLTGDPVPSALIEDTHRP